MNMFGLGRPRTNLGKWMENRGIRHEWLMKKGNLSKGTVSNACADEDYIPSGSTMKKIIKALREVDPSVRADQFWDL